MRPGKPTSAPAGNEAPANAPTESSLSLSRLRDAFAAMLGGREAEKPTANDSRVSPEPENGSPPRRTALRACEINARTVVEAMLFVGRPDNGPLSARELAAAMRGVSPGEIDAAIVELNSTYDADSAPYWIEQNNGGYPLGVRDEVPRRGGKILRGGKKNQISPAGF